MKELLADHNQLSGTLPESFGNLTAFYFDVQANFLTGEFCGHRPLGCMHFDGWIYCIRCVCMMSVAYRHCPFVMGADDSPRIPLHEREFADWW
mgnify:CR=1 FL=1